MINHGRATIDAHIEAVRLMRGRLVDAGAWDTDGFPVSVAAMKGLLEKAEQMADEIERLRDLIADQANFLLRHPGNAKAVAQKLLKL